jgi:hypothetical protein
VRVTLSLPRSAAIRRTDYLIDSYHVSFESGAGWHCQCTEFEAAGDCRHTREAQGRHAAQVLISNRLLIKPRTD